MEVSELTLWLARLAVLALMYLFLLGLIMALMADARAASNPRTPPAPPVVTPPPVIRTLAVTDGTLPSTGTEYLLTGPLEIGRGSECDIAITNRFISSRHARIYQQNGQWMVEDLGSTNGSLLNGKPLTAPQPLNPGDVLVVGDTKLTLR